MDIARPTGPPAARPVARVLAPVSHRTPLPLLPLLTFLTLLAATACTPTHTPSAPGEDPPATAATGARQPRSADVPRPADTPRPAAVQRSVEPPRLDGAGETVAGRQGAVRGDGRLGYTGGARGKALIVAVSCQGEGSVSVEVPTVAVSYRLRCGGVVPEVAYDEISLGASHRPGTVVVTAPSAVTWAATVGRGDRAEREPSGIG